MRAIVHFHFCNALEAFSQMLEEQHRDLTFSQFVLRAIEIATAYSGLACVKADPADAQVNWIDSITQPLRTSESGVNFTPLQAKEVMRAALENASTFGIAHPPTLEVSHELNKAFEDPASGLIVARYPNRPLRLLSTIYGDGESLLVISPVTEHSGPFCVLVDSTFDANSDALPDDIYEALCSEFGCNGDEGASNQPDPPFRRLDLTLGFHSDMMSLPGPIRDRVAASVATQLGYMSDDHRAARRAGGNVDARRFHSAFRP